MIKYLIFILLLLQGCTLFIGETKDDIFSKNDISPQKVPDQLFCPEKQTFSLISENEKSSENFKRFLKKIDRKYNLTFIEKVVLWSLAQFNIRPDNASPHAKLQYLLEYLLAVHQNVHCNFLVVRDKIRDPSWRSSRPHSPRLRSTR